ncbi:MAG TPA: M23 family metallopeptidase [Woeseiaceae bacterium]|nr:M23 family metallopeptidase [Woeseiaceae bacterium]
MRSIRKPAWSLLSMFSLTLMLAGVSAETACADPPLRQSFGMRVPVPPSPVVVVGESQLVYELHLTNFASTGLVLEQLEVTDATGDNVLLELDAAELERRLYRPGAGSEGMPDARLIEAGKLGIVYLEMMVQSDAYPQNLEHRITFHSEGEAKESAAVEGGSVSVRPEPPIVLSSPLRGGPWAAIHDAAWPRGHRRFIYAVDGEATIPGRYAIDWVLLDDDGRYATGDRDVVTNRLGYGAEVLSVAEGTVVAARDDIAESELVSEHPDHPLEDAAGNYVAIDIGNGRVAFFEHLKPGSVRVRAGDRVRRGQVIGALGFTGHSTGPHLHFHVADRNSPLGAEGVPFAIEAFELLGRYPEFERFGEERWTPLADEIGKRRRAERPPSNSVVMFR